MSEPTKVYGRKRPAKDTKPCLFWRITFRVRVDRGTHRVEYKHHSFGVPGTKRQAVEHLRAVCLKMWPSAQLRLLRAAPDRIAEANSEKEGGWWGRG